MKKILLFVTVLAVASSCVDDGFDLSQVNADDIAIGSNESKFKIPLANITVKEDAIRGENDSLESMLKDADVLIPADFGKLDLQNVPADALVEGLFDELRSDGSRRQEVGEFLENSKHRNEVVATLPANLRELDLEEVFSHHFDILYDRKELRDKMKEIIVKSVDSFNETLPDINEAMDGFGIDEDMINMLTGTGEMRLYGTVTNLLPFDGKAFLILTKKDGSEETIVRLELPLDYTDPSQDFSVNIDNAVLRGMTGSMEMHVSLELSFYYPRNPSSDADGTVLKIALKLEKQGGLNIGGITED